jgi:hypothetical protein
MPKSLLRFRYGFSTNDESLARTRADLFLDSDQAGSVLFLFDAEALTLAPVTNLALDGSPVRNLAKDAAAPTLVDGQVQLTAGQTLALAGGGLDMQVVTERDNGVLVPADVMARHWAAGAGRQISIGAVVKLPAEVDWPAASLRFLSFGNTINGFNNGVEPYGMGFQTAGALKRVFAIRQHAAAPGSAASLAVTVPPQAFGQVCLWHYRRTPAGQRATLFYPGGSVATAVIAAGAENTQDFSARTGLFGVPLPTWAAGLAGQTAHKRFTCDRLWIENPALAPTRDPDAMAAADWARVQARGAFS